MEKIAPLENLLKCLDFIVTHGIVLCGRICQIEQSWILQKALKNKGLLAILVGDPGMTRTCDLRFRKPSLYPAELRDRIDFAQQFLPG
jgi:hypothetical protein